MAEYVNIRTNSIDKNIPTKDTFEASLPKSKTVTLTASGWNNNTQTVTVNGVSASEATQLITVSPTKTKVNKYIESGIYCSGQAENSLIFTCSEAPTEDIIIYVTIEPVSLPFSSVLDENSWEELQLAAELGIGQNYWSVGDCKQITMNGKVSDILTLTNYTAWVYIIGFNHNAEKEGNGITFQGFKATDKGTPVCLVDSQYDNDGKWTDALFVMNNAPINTGGWETCSMRQDIMPLIKSAFPADLQAVIKTSTIFTAPDTGNIELTATQDEIFLLAEYEVFGAHKYGSLLEVDYLKQYAYYSAGNSKVNYKHDATSTTAIWWGRSPRSSDTHSFCIVYTTGNASAGYANFSWGVAPCFKVGKEKNS